MTLPVVIETLSIAAPLGLCFHDVTTGERINDGLSVSVYQANAGPTKKRTTALPNRRGVYVLHKAYGLENFANGKGDTEFWESNPPQKKYVVEVSDAERRFQSFRFDVRLPVRGIYKWENLPPVSPNKNQSSIPLYSAPSRQVTGGMSVVRAQMREAGGKPASYAVLEARLNGVLAARGISAKDGQVVLIFPSLSPPNNSLASPPSAAKRVSLVDLEWNLTLKIKYQPNIFNSSPSDLSGSDEEYFPDLRLALAQSAGKIWADAEQIEEYQTVALKYGKELILRSQAMSSSPAPDSSVQSLLFISPAI